VFYVTVAENKSHEITRFTMEKDRVMYLIYDDEAHPPPPELLKRTKDEEQFMAEYLAKKGKGVIKR